MRFERILPLPLPLRLHRSCSIPPSSHHSPFPLSSSAFHCLTTFTVPNAVLWLCVSILDVEGHLLISLDSQSGNNSWSHPPNPNKDLCWNRSMPQGCLITVFTASPTLFSVNTSTPTATNYTYAHTSEKNKKKKQEKCPHIFLCNCTVRTGDDFRLYHFYSTSAPHLYHIYQMRVCFFNDKGRHHELHHLLQLLELGSVWKIPFM